MTTFLRLCVLLLCAPSALADVSIARNTVTKDVRMPLFGRDKSHPAAVVTIGTLRLGAARSGVFRIGASPLVVCENVTVTFKVSDPTAFAGFPSTMSALAKVSTMELRNLAVYPPGNGAPVLTAERVEITDGEPWQLRNITLPNGTKAESATLTVSGKKLGLLSFDRKGRRSSITLFTP